MVNLHSKLLSLLAEGEAARAREKAQKALKINVSDTRLESQLRDSSADRLSNSERVVIIGIGSYATQSFLVMRDSMLDRLCVDVPAAACLSRYEEVTLKPEIARKYLTNIRGKSLMRFPMVEGYHAIVAPNNVFSIVELEGSNVGYFVTQLACAVLAGVSPQAAFIETYNILCSAVEALAIPIGRKYWSAIVCVRVDENNGTKSLKALDKDVVVDLLNTLVDAEYLVNLLIEDPNFTEFFGGDEKVDEEDKQNAE